MLKSKKRDLKKVVSSNVDIFGDMGKKRFFQCNQCYFSGFVAAKGVMSKNRFYIVITKKFRFGRHVDIKRVMAKKKTIFL